METSARMQWWQSVRSPGSGTLKAIAIAVLLSLMLAACAGDEDAIEDDSQEPGADAEPAGQELRAAMTFIGEAGDGSFSTLAVDSLQHIDTQFEEVTEIAYTDRVDAAAAERVIRGYAQDGFDVIYAQSGTHFDPAMNVAPDFPDQVFVVWASGTGFSMDDVPANVYVLGNEFEEAYYYLGALAGMMTESKQLGFISGIEIPVYVAGAVAYEEGAQSIDPDVSVSAVFTGNFDDAVAAQSATRAMIEGGADIIQATLLLAQFGVFDVVEQSDDVRVIGAYLDQYDLSPDTVLTSMVVDYPEAFSRVIEGVLAGETGGYIPVSLSAGTMSIPIYEQLPDGVEERLAEIQEALARGEIEYTDASDL